jgi:uncharacterized protein
MSFKFLFSRLLLPVIASVLLMGAAEARFVTLADLPKTVSFKDAIAKLEKDPKDKDAAAAIKKAADGGDKDAMFAYAFILQNALGGLEAPKDKPTALVDDAKKLYQKAVDAGQTSALNNLMLLRIATGDDAKASVEALEKAANSGNARARITLAEMYLEGIGVEKNPELSLRWLERAQEAEPNEATFLIALIKEAAKDELGAVNNLLKAAEGGHVPAMIYLGNKIINGKGVQPNIEEARKWFTKAVEAGVNSAKVNLGVLSEVEAALESNKKDADKAKVTELYKKALAFYQEAADLKVAEAYNKIGFYHEKGLGVTKDETKAYEWYKKGADAGLAVSFYNIGVMLEEGRGVKAKDEAEAIKNFYTAAKAGLGEAQSALAGRYRAGKTGLEKDPIAAMAWMEKAAQAGNMNSQIELANMLETGEAGFVNLKTSAELYFDAAKKGSPIAMFQISDMLEKGRGMQRDLVQAYAFLTTCTKLTSNDPNFGKQAADRLAELKKKMTVEEITKGDEMFKQLTGVANTPTPASAPAPKETPPATAPKDKPKTR